MIDVEVPGGTLRVSMRESEEATGIPVLLVHGVTASHLAWSLVADRLPHTRVVAPDLRGRGGSRDVKGPAGLARHADDLAAVLDALDISRAIVVGHSMGAFVSVVFADRHPHRVERLVLVDGGLPLDVPSGIPPENLVAAILGPTADRLAMRFADVEAYLEFWRAHPAFRGDWPEGLAEYFTYDLVPDGGYWRPATRLETVVEDTEDMTAGEALPSALARLRHPTTLLTVPRGLRDEEPGLYAPAHLERVLAAHPGIAHTRLDDLNHYTVVMSDRGAGEVVAAIQSAT